MKLLLVAGGGGHFAPALSLIESLPKDWEAKIIGRKYAFEADKTVSLEYQTAQKLKIPFAAITTGRFQRKLSKHSIQSIAKIPVGLFQSLKIIKQYKPDVVVSFGGYVSLPVALAAKALKVPIIVHEQTMGAGLANKVVGKFADAIAVSWKQSESNFPKEKITVTGNPLQKTFIEDLKKPSKVDKNEQLPLIYVTGGSGGAHAINVFIEECLERLLEHYRVIHQTGDAKQFGDFDRLEKLKKSFPEKLQKRYLVTKFVDSNDVFTILKQADLVIARAGIGTVTQLLALGKPCLFIPLPYGQKNEQLTNANFVKKIGIGEVAQQYFLTGDALYALIEKMFQNLSKYSKHSDEAKAVIDLQATDKLISLITHVKSEDQKKITQS
jgi:UDP-N-acetylglucosamine--N-acetylmuramyl-(pentapeptide) pyrophosphoryl-undecaprenol N-acetylglucosamine transferase